PADLDGVDRDGARTRVEEQRRTRDERRILAHALERVFDLGSGVLADDGHDDDTVADVVRDHVGKSSGRRGRSAPQGLPLLVLPDPAVPISGPLDVMPVTRSDDPGLYPADARSGAAVH